MTRSGFLICTVEQRVCIEPYDCPSVEPTTDERPLGYLCTRPRGHTGPHVACGTRAHEHNIAVWEDELAPPQS